MKWTTQKQAEYTSVTPLLDKDGNRHTFSFEITWLIGDDSNATVTLDDGTVREIKDMYGFCEYVVNAFEQLPFEKKFWQGSASGFTQSIAKEKIWKKF